MAVRDHMFLGAEVETDCHNTLNPETPIFLNYGIFLKSYLGSY